MKNYYYTVKFSPFESGKYCVNVYEVKSKSLIMIGSSDMVQNGVNDKGSNALACKVLNETKKHRLSKCRYYLLSKKITVREIV